MSYKIRAEAHALCNGIKIPRGWEEIWKYLEIHKVLVVKEYQLYIIEEVGSGFVKIGRSTHPSRRVKDLQTGHPGKLLLKAYCREESPYTEKEVHERLKEHNIRGEWYYLVPEVINVVQEIKTRKRVCNAYKERA